MPRPPGVPAEEKARLVLAILAGEISIAVEVKAALGEADVELRVGSARPTTSTIEDLEVIRTEAGMPITRFAELIGMPRRTYTRHRSRWLKSDPVKAPGPPRWSRPSSPWWPRLAEAWPAWMHRKIHAMHRLDHPELAASPSSVERAMRRRGLLQPVDYQAERRQHAQARREAFVEPPTRRNQVWQPDF